MTFMDTAVDSKQFGVCVHSRRVQNHVHKFTSCIDKQQQREQQQREQQQQQQQRAASSTSGDARRARFSYKFKNIGHLPPAELIPEKSCLDGWHPEMGSQQLQGVGRSLLWVRPGHLPLWDPGL